MTQELRDALAGLIGLCELLDGRDDLPHEVHNALRSSHRLIAARVAWRKAESLDAVLTLGRGNGPLAVDALDTLLTACDALTADLAKRVPLVLVTNEFAGTVEWARAVLYDKRKE